MTSRWLWPLCGLGGAHVVQSVIDKEQPMERAEDSYRTRAVGCHEECDRRIKGVSVMEPEWCPHIGNEPSESNACATGHPHAA
jgi:hypothetical protein